MTLYCIYSYIMNDLLDKLSTDDDLYRSHFLENSWSRDFSWREIVEIIQIHEPKDDHGRANGVDLAEFDSEIVEKIKKRHGNFQLALSAIFSNSIAYWPNAWLSPIVVFWDSKKEIYKKMLKLRENHGQPKYTIFIGHWLFLELITSWTDIFDTLSLCSFSSDKCKHRLKSLLWKNSSILLLSCGSTWWPLNIAKKLSKVLWNYVTGFSLSLHYWISKISYVCNVLSAMSCDINKENNFQVGRYWEIQLNDKHLYYDSKVNSIRWLPDKSYITNNKLSSIMHIWNTTPYVKTYHKWKLLS